jgi:hypothetical protein
MTIAATPLLAANKWETLVSRFRGEFSHSGLSGLITNALLLTIVVVLMVSVGYLILRQIREKRANLPQGLFSELCAIHALSSSDRRLLKRLAAYQDLPDASMLFLEPKFFTMHAGPLEEQREALAHLRQRLFD